MGLKMCDRCRVGGCTLDYLGKACESARKKWSPETRLSNAEYIADMDEAAMAIHIPLMFEFLCQDGMPSTELILEYLRQDYSGDYLEY